MPLLRYTSPSQETVFVELNRESVIIGRSKDVDLTITDPMSSRKHCEVRRQTGGSWLLVDLESKNGTFVNGSPVSHWSLKDGDLISIGAATIMFKLQK